MKQLVESIQQFQKRSLGPQSAVLGIHWQRDVVAPAGTLDQTFANSVKRKGVIPRTARLFAYARQRGAKIIYVNVAFDPGYVGIIANNALWSMVSKSSGFIRGTPGADIVAELTPAENEVILTHTRISSFYGSDLLTVLIGHRITDLYLTGVATNVAVDHTARDAVQLGFNTVIVEDCCASSDDRFHDASIQTLRVLCTEVVQAQDIVT